MGKPTGFMEIERQDRGYKPPENRVTHYDEFYMNLAEDAVSDQGALARPLRSPRTKRWWWWWWCCCCCCCYNFLF